MKVGEYINATRYPFNGQSPGLSFFGKERGNNKLSGEFVVWELEMKGAEIVKLAIDSTQRGEEKGPPSKGKVRINSAFE